MIHYYIGLTGYRDVLESICKSYMLSRFKKSEMWFIQKSIVKACILKKLERVKISLEQGILVGNCVTISCWVFARLLYSGLKPEICIGVRCADEKVYSHMWVTCENVDYSTDTIVTYRIIEKIDYNTILRCWIERE